MWAPPTSTDHTTSGLAAWIFAMTGAKLLTSSAKNSTAMSSPPASRIIFCIHFEVIWP